MEPALNAIKEEIGRLRANRHKITSDLPDYIKRDWRRFNISDGRRIAHYEEVWDLLYFKQEAEKCETPS